MEDPIDDEGSDVFSVGVPKRPSGLPVDGSHGRLERLQLDGWSGGLVGKHVALHATPDQFGAADFKFMRFFVKCSNGVGFKADLDFLQGLMAN